MPFEVHFGCWGWPWTSCWRPLEMPRAWPGSRTGPGTPEWAGLHSRPGGSTFYWDPGIEITAQVEGDLAVLGPTINLTTA